MSDSFLSPENKTIFLSGIIAVIAVAGHSQDTGPNAAATARAGMTSGLPAGASSSGRQMEMMQVRNSAQQDQHQAAAAQMARSADEAIEDRNQRQAIEQARETKKLKKDATNRMKWERSSAAYNKVTADQMSTWKDRAGNVRVERNVPNEFLLALRQEEAALVDESARKEKRGFHPLRATRNAIGNVPRPFKKNKTSYEGGRLNNSAAMNNSTAETLPETGGRSGGGLKFRPPRLPFSKGGRREKIENAKIANAESATQRPMPAQVGGTASASTGTTAPGRVPEISGAALVDGRSSIGRGQQASSGSSMKKASGDFGVASQASVAVPSSKPEKKGFFASRKSSRSSRSGGGFGFGKKKSKQSERGTVDGSLFPAGSTDQAPRGGDLSSDSGASEVVEMQMASTGDVELPGQTKEKKRKKGFSMPKPSIPSIAKSDDEGSRKSKASNTPLTTINANGNSFYHVSNQAQFMKYGESQMQSEITTLSAGVLLKMTKPGAQWASVELSDGTKGVIQVGNLQAASSGAIPSNFGVPAVAASQ